MECGRENQWWLQRNDLSFWKELKPWHQRNLVFSAVQLWADHFVSLSAAALGPA